MYCRFFPVRKLVCRQNVAAPEILAPACPHFLPRVEGCLVQLWFFKPGLTLSPFAFNPTLISSVLKLLFLTLKLVFEYASLKWLFWVEQICKITCSIFIFCTVYCLDFAYLDLLLHPDIADKDKFVSSSVCWHQIIVDFKFINQALGGPVDLATSRVI